MGLCPSRNKNSQVGGKSYEPQHEEPRATAGRGLRADAAEFVPAAKGEQANCKEPWELFLDQKRTQLVPGTPEKPFARLQDGTYTAEYRKLLESGPRAARTSANWEVAGATGAVSGSLLQAWKDCAPAPKPAKVQKKRTVDKLQLAIRKATELPTARVLELLDTASSKVQAAQDDSAACSKSKRMVPFGLSDRHYLSGGEDNAKSHIHRSLKPTPVREYAAGAVTGELEEAMTEVLHKLRLLRLAEEQSKRYCVGLREVMRAAKQGALRAILVAPDLDKDSGKGVDEKLQQLLRDVNKSKTPVVFGLSRLRLGQAIQKNVSVSVLGILDTRGVQAPFDRMVELA